MKPLRKYFALLTVIAVMACTPVPPSPVVVANIDWIGYQPLYLAQQLEYFDDRSVRLLELTSASEVLRNFRNGIIPVAALTLDEALLLAQDGIDIKIILVMDVSHGADAIVARPNIADVNALRGKKIGVEKSAVGAYLLSRALLSFGMSVEDIQTVPVEFGEHENTFRSGDIDAVVTFEPVRSRLLEHDAHVVFDSRQIPDEIVDVLVVRTEYLQQHGQEIAPLIGAWFKALAFMQDQHAQAIDYLAPMSKLSEEDYVKASEGIRFPSYRENIKYFNNGAYNLHRTAQNLQAVMLKQHLLTKAVPLDSLFDPSLLKHLEP